MKLSGALFLLCLATFGAAGLELAQLVGRGRAGAAVGQLPSEPVEAGSTDRSATMRSATGWSATAADDGVRLSSFLEKRVPVPPFGGVPASREQGPRPAAQAAVGSALPGAESDSDLALDSESDPDSDLALDSDPFEEALYAQVGRTPSAVYVDGPVTIEVNGRSITVSSELVVY